MKKIKQILLQTLLIIWHFPQCLVGLLMLPFLGKLSYNLSCGNPFLQGGEETRLILFN